MVISRVGYCDKCAKAERPRHDSFFVVCGSHGWHVYRSKGIGKPGYVPTLYRLIKAIGENIVYEKQCSMHDCSVEIEYRSGMYHFTLGKWERGMMTRESWNALCNLKDTGYEV